MRKFLQNKLWRDKAPDMMRSQGSIIHVINLTDKEYEEQLKIKLLEEAQEVCDAYERESIIEEMADLTEVIDALCALHRISLDELDAVQMKKRQERGGFYERAFVTVAEHPAGSFGEKYCRAQPDKYPEIF